MEAKSSADRQKINARARTARGLLALADGRYEEAGRHFAEIGEEGGLKDWEGVVSPLGDCEIGLTSGQLRSRCRVDCCSLHLVNGGQITYQENPARANQL